MVKATVAPEKARIKKRHQCAYCGELSGSISKGTGAPLIRERETGRFTHVSCGEAPASESFAELAMLERMGRCSVAALQLDLEACVIRECSPCWREGRQYVMESPLANATGAGNGGWDTCVQCGVSSTLRTG